MHGLLAGCAARLSRRADPLGLPQGPGGPDRAPDAPPHSGAQTAPPGTRH